MQNWSKYGLSRWEDYYITPHWLELRRKYIYSNPHAQCFICGAMSTLVLHHIWYRNIYKEKLWRDLYILCWNCHGQVHVWPHSSIKVPKSATSRRWLLTNLSIRKAIYCIQKKKFGACLWYVPRCSFALVLGL